MATKVARRYARKFGNVSIERCKGFHPNSPLTRAGLNKAIIATVCYDGGESWEMRAIFPGVLSADDIDTVKDAIFDGGGSYNGGPGQPYERRAVVNVRLGCTIISKCGGLDI